jgi:Kelch motif
VDLRGVRQRWCCDALPGQTRRQFLRTTIGSVAAIAGGGLLSSCFGGDGAVLPQLPSSWRMRSPAPFIRHAHSGAAAGSRLIAMGDRRGIDIREGETSALDPQLTVEVTATEFAFSLSEIDVPLGVPVRVLFTNAGLVDHDLVVPGSGVYVRAQPGETAEVVAIFRQPEVFFCSIGGHADIGMVGEILIDGVRPTQDDVAQSDGVTEMWWYLPDSDSYEPGPDLPHAFDHVSLVAVGESVYSIGGYTGDIGSSRADVWLLESGGTGWQRMADLPIPRGAMAAATDGKRIYCAGGRTDAEGTPSSQEVFAYDPLTDTWETLSTLLPTGRDHVAGAIVDDVFWVVGGRGDGRRLSSTPVTEGLDLRSGEWIVGAPLPVPESAGGVAALDGRVIVFGGEGPAPTPNGAAGHSFLTYSDVLGFDPARNEWSSLSEMPVGVHHTAYGVIESRLYTIGGGNVSGVSATNHTQELSIES